MNFDKALKEFGKALGKLKEAYAEECDCNSSCLCVNANEDNYVTIIPTDETGKYIETFRDWVSVEE